jgi:hypothetical protein
MELYARRIHECQHDLWLEVSSFYNIAMSATSFLWEFIRKQDNDTIDEDTKWLMKNIKQIINMNNAGDEFEIKV